MSQPVNQLESPSAAATQRAAATRPVRCLTTKLMCPPGEPARKPALTLPEARRRQKPPCQHVAPCRAAQESGAALPHAPGFASVQQLLDTLALARLRLDLRVEHAVV